MENISIPEIVEITADDWVGFKVVVPNGTSIHLVNQFLVEVLLSAVILVNQRRPTSKGAELAAPVNSNANATVRPPG